MKRRFGAASRNRGWASSAKICALILVTGSVCAADPLATWHVRHSPESVAEEELEGVAFGNGRWVVVGGDGTILSSPDGVEWGEEVNPLGSVGFSDVVFGNGMFVAVGRAWNSLITSPDGKTWTKQTPNMSGASELIFDGTRFMTVLSGGFVKTSTNGVNWENKPGVPLNYDVGGLAFGNGLYVEAGYKRTGKPPDVFSSNAAGEWVQRNSKLDENLMNASFDLGMFLVYGQDGALATSPDGVEWTPRTVPHSGFIWDMASSGQHLVAAAQWGRLLISPDGINWTKHETDLIWHLTDIAYGDGTFIAVGWNGQIVQSDRVTTTGGEEIRLSQPSKAAGAGSFSFQVSGEAGKNYRVETSPDLMNWAVLKTVSMTASPTAVTDAAPAGPNRFYRVVLP